MMLCVDKEMFHESTPARQSGPLPARAGAAGLDGRQDPRDGHASPAPAPDQHRPEVLLRVVRISDALNQRLAR